MTDNLMFTPVTIADADRDTVTAFLNTLQTHQTDHHEAWDALQQQAEDYKLHVEIHQPGALPTEDRRCSRCLDAFADENVIVSSVSEASGYGFMFCMACIEALPDWNVRATMEYSLLVDWTVDDLESYTDVYELHQAQCEVAHNRE